MLRHNLEKDQSKWRSGAYWLYMKPTSQVAAFVGWVAMGVFMVPAIAQDSGPQQQAKPSMMAKDADPDWEVVTVRPSDPNATSDYLDQYGRRLQFANKTVEMLLTTGYNVHKSQLADMPEWVRTAHWDINGVSNMDGRMDLTQLQGMIRKVLAERFGLQLHREQREMPVFALTVAKGGPKMTQSTADPKGRVGQHPREGPGWHMELMTNASMPELALTLEFRSDRPVVDKTELKGRYDFQLKWLTDDNHAGDPDAPPGLFTAIQEQLGLKLEPVKAPADVLVIDKVERPGAN
jgi:uncharacterized protein (TIGR03435 family)